MPGCANAPRPLRDEFHPDGLPDLTNSELTRVQLANSTYEATTELAIHAANLGASLSVEIPLNSLFWLTTATTTMLSKLAGKDVVFDHCMMGGRRDKTTRLWTFVPQGQDASLFQSLNLRCSRDHEHASWKPRWVDNRWIFPTADEAAYPTVLCTRLASALQQLICSNKQTWRKRRVADLYMQDSPEATSGCLLSLCMAAHRSGPSLPTMQIMLKPF